MDEQQKYCYTEEVLIHVEVAQNELDMLRTLLGARETIQSREVWVRLQSFLTHVGMVSKLFFPPTGNKVSKQRGLDLQAHLEIDSKNPINNRDARNAIEHLDERMDNWLSGDKRGFLESVFENREGLDYMSSDRWAIRRAFILDEFAFVVEEDGERKIMPLEPIIEALTELRDKCIQTLQENNELKGSVPFYRRKWH